MTTLRELRNNLEKAMNADNKALVPEAKKALRDFVTGKARTMAPSAAAVDRAEYVPPAESGSFGSTKPRKPTSRKSTSKPK